MDRNGNIITKRILKGDTILKLYEICVNCDFYTHNNKISSLSLSLCRQTSNTVQKQQKYNLFHEDNLHMP